MQNQTIFELYTDDNKSKYSSNPNDILKSAKTNYKKLYIKRTSTAATTEFVGKIPNRKKISNEHFNLWAAEISLNEIIKSIDSETNNKPQGNDGLKAEFLELITFLLASVQISRHIHPHVLSCIYQYRI